MTHHGFGMNLHVYMQSATGQLTAEQTNTKLMGYLEASRIEGLATGQKKHRRPKRSLEHLAALARSRGLLGGVQI